MTATTSACAAGAPYSDDAVVLRAADGTEAHVVPAHGAVCALCRTPTESGWVHLLAPIPFRDAVHPRDPLLVSLEPRAALPDALHVSATRPDVPAGLRTLLPGAPQRAWASLSLSHKVEP